MPVSEACPVTIYMIVSVDWEGRDIVAESIDVMAAFRADNPHIPLQHFLNAAYYTKASADLHHITTQTRRVVLDGDTQGLHIHPWKTLAEASGVDARINPNIRSQTEPLRVVDDDWGHEVALHHYQATDIHAMVVKSMEILATQGFEIVPEFRSGAWLSGRTVTEALAEAGFRLDCSAANRRFLEPRWGEMPLFSMLAELWPEVGDTTQPYQQMVKGTTLWQIPNNGCLADYTSAEQVAEVFANNIKAAARTDSYTGFMSTGFHQETAALYLDRLAEGLQLCEDLAAREQVELQYIASPIDYL